MSTATIRELRPSFLKIRATARTPTSRSHRIALALIWRIYTLAACAAVVVLAGGLRAGIEPKNFDMSVKPQDDFFRYVNGTWLKPVVIPPDQSRWGGFVELTEGNWANVQAICERRGRRCPDAPCYRRTRDDLVS